MLQVLERGMSLQQWREHQRGFGELLTLLDSLAHMLHILHSAGKVHRDLYAARLLMTADLQHVRLHMQSLHVLAVVKAQQE